MCTPRICHALLPLCFKGHPASGHTPYITFTRTCRHTIDPLTPRCSLHLCPFWFQGATSWPSFHILCMNVQTYSCCIYNKDIFLLHLQQSHITHLCLITSQGAMDWRSSGPQQVQLMPCAHGQDLGGSLQWRQLQRVWLLQRPHPLRYRYTEIWNDVL